MYNNSFSTRIKRQYQALKTQFKKLPEKERKTKLFGFIIFAIISFLGCASISGSFVIWFNKMFEPTGNFKGAIYYGLTNKAALIGTIFIFGMVLFFTLALAFRRGINNGILVTDDRGVSIMMNGERGTARYMNEDETKREFKVGDILETDQTVYGQLTEDGTQTVSYKAKKKGSSGNQNLLLIGSPGTGKSFCFVRTNIVQAMLRGSSIIATDPSGELYQDLGSLLRKNGYNVRVLNLAEPRYSDFWNCMEEVIDEETGRLDGTRLNDFTDIYVKNSGDPTSKGEKFWTDGAVNFLRSVIGYASYQRESKILTGYRALYTKVATNNPEKENILDNKMKDMVSFAWCEHIILDTAIKNGFDEEEIASIILNIKETAPPFTIKEVYECLMSFNSKVGEFVKIPMSHPARQAFIIFSDAPETVKVSVINGTRLSMQIFADDKLMGALSHDGIKISDINKEKCAYFVNMSDKSKATTPIASLFFSFFFKDAQDNWDKWAKISDEKGIPNPCLDTFVMLDEFFSIGVIGGDPNAFATTMSVNRKRHISINIAIQSISQLPALYGIANADNIQTCCDYTLFLGCNDQKTARLISEYFAGDATVLAERHNETVNTIGSFGDGMNINMSSVNRKLLTQSEVREWKDKVFLAKRGEHPLELKLFPWTLHPCYVNGETKKISIYSTIKPIEERLLEFEISKPKEPDKEIKENIENAHSSYSKDKINTEKKSEQITLSLPSNSVPYEEDDPLKKAQQRNAENRQRTKATREQTKKIDKNKMY